jgi:uncharacterized protein YheU (UPF0270 family)
MIEIDHQQLDPATLDNLLGELVLREGTDYGALEYSLDDKKKQLHQLLIEGKVVITFNNEDGSCDVVRRESRFL